MTMTQTSHSPSFCSVNSAQYDYLEQGHVIHTPPSIQTIELFVHHVAQHAQRLLARNNIRDATRRESGASRHGARVRAEPRQSPTHHETSLSQIE